MKSRRDFLKGLGLGVAAITALRYIPAATPTIVTEFPPCKPLALQPWQQHLYDSMHHHADAMRYIIAMPRGHGKHHLYAQYNMYYTGRQWV